MKETKSYKFTSKNLMAKNSVYNFPVHRHLKKQDLCLLMFILYYPQELLIKYKQEWMIRKMKL